MATQLKIAVQEISILDESPLWECPAVPENPAIIRAFKLRRLDDDPDKYLYIVFVNKGPFNHDGNVLIAPVADLVIPKGKSLGEVACELFVAQGF